VWRKFFELLRVSTLTFDLCAREVFQVLESFKFQMCQREFFANVTSFKSNFKFVQEIFFKCLRVFCKVFVL
jgi:hypothetical protein